MLAGGRQGQALFLSLLGDDAASGARRTKTDTHTHVCHCDTHTHTHVRACSHPVFTHVPAQEVVSVKFSKTLIHSVGALSYKQAQAHLDKPDRYPAAPRRAAVRCTALC